MQSRTRCKALSNLFGLHGSVSRAAYVVAGLILAPLKYCVEAAAIYGLSGKFFTPIDFFNPWLSGREYFTADAPTWFGMVWVLWTLPFLWIGVTMSVRRSQDIGFSPWLGLLIVVPIANFVCIAMWAALPTNLRRTSRIVPQSGDPSSANAVPHDSDKIEISEQQFHEIYRPTMTADLPEPSGITGGGFAAAVMGIVAGIVYMVSIVLLSVYLFGSYGAALFFGTPIVTGAVAAFFLNRLEPVSILATILHSFATMSLTCCVLLFVGLEGIICIFMAIPIVVPLGLIGAVVGRAIAIDSYNSWDSSQRGLYSCMTIVPLLIPLENQLSPSPQYEVRSVVEIAAPIEAVWNNVIDFPEINETPDWYFRMGIAYPKRARIDGAGVGATRYCEFTTGVFVEPITNWSKPTRLSFDVTEQPDPMFELSPYRHLHPPHLDGAFRSVRGEFRLTSLSPARTRLEGSTWYTLDIRPVTYWTIWTDWIIHRIHMRVLSHIQRNAEANRNWSS